MPKPFLPTRAFSAPANHAALTIAFGDHFPAGCNAHIFPDGLFRVGDGRPASMTNGEVRDWQMNAAVAERLIAALSAGKPILYDYEHNSRYGDSRAAGWIDALTYEQGRGLFAHVAWTPDAAEAIANKEYCYSSPFFKFDGAGNVTKLLSVALTNNPALDELGAVDLTRDSTNQGDPAMPPSEQQVAALTSERDGLKADVVALSVERDNLKTQAAALTTERDALAAKVAAAEKVQAEAQLTADKAKHAEVLTAALTDGRLTPAQKPWAEKQSLAALSEYLDATKPLPLTQTQANGTGTGVAALTADEAAMCARMGVTHDDYRKAKTA